jgi:hypothetical protein
MPLFTVSQNNGDAIVLVRNAMHFGVTRIAVFSGGNKELAYDDAWQLAQRMNELVTGYVACYPGATVCDDDADAPNEATRYAQRIIESVSAIPDESLRAVLIAQMRNNRNATLRQALDLMAVISNGFRRISGDDTDVQRLMRDADALTVKINALN